MGPVLYYQGPVRLRLRPLEKRVLSALFGLLFALALAFVMGCDRQIAPPLVDVTELSPREVEPGDRLEVHGAGFPQGRTGRLTFDGTVYRAGEGPSRVVVDADGTVVTPDRIEVVVRDAFAARFCGRGDRAAHATFRGDVQVAFASMTPDAPPLTGMIRSVSLDVLPSSSSAIVAEARTGEGSRVLSFLGVVPAAPTSRGIPIEKVAPGSPAERARILVGDVIVAVDGVHVLSFADLVPASSRSAELTIRHGDTGLEETQTISVVQYTGERVPKEYAPALVLVGLAIAAMIILVLPGPPMLATIEMRIAARLRRQKVAALLGALVGVGRHAALSAILSAIALAFALTPYVVNREIDGAALVAVIASTLGWSKLAVERTAMSALRVLVPTAAALFAMIAAIALTVLHVGAIELAEIVRVQGGLPWQLTATRNPACAIAAAVYCASVVGVLRLRPIAQTATPQVHAALLERTGVILAAALCVMVFFGGWRLPVASEPRTSGLMLAAGAVFLVKTWAITALFFGARSVGARLPARDLSALVAKRLLPALVAAAALVAVSRRLVPGSTVETAFGATAVALAGLFIVRCAARIRAAVMRPEPHASPFL
jgi:NADH-quinone oxidoreductase subunit H